jgi:hypothetical protein
MKTGAPADPLRAEHDALASRLEIRRSIDELRKGLGFAFCGLISVGFAIRLAWDRWGPPRPGTIRKLDSPPILFCVATVVAIALLALTIRFSVRAHRLMREESSLWARFRQVRNALGLDP